MSNNFLSADALGKPVTFKTYDTGNAIQSSQVIVSDITGAPYSNTNLFHVDGSNATQPISAVALPLPTGAALAVKQPGLGTPGSSSSDVLTIQGVTNMTPLVINLPTGAAVAAKQPAIGIAGTASADVLTVQGALNMIALRVDGSATIQPVSASSLPLPSGAATAAKQPAIGVAGTASADVITVQGSVAMTPLLVNGSAVVQPVSWAGQSVALSGTLPAFTSPPTVNLGTISTAATAALQTSGNSTLVSILTALQGQRSESLWTDDTGSYFVRVDNAGTLSWTDVSGNTIAAPSTGARPASGSNAIVDKTSYQVSTAATGMSVGDFVDHFVTTDPNTGVMIGHFWLNLSTELKLASNPTTANLTPLSLLPVGAATSALQTSINTALALLHTDLTGVATTALQTTGNASLVTLHTDLTATNVALALLHTDISTEAAIQSTSALQTAGNTALATLHTDLTTTNTALTQLHTDLSTQATAVLQTTANTSLATLHTDVTATNTALALVHTDLTGVATTALQVTGNTALATLHTDLTTTNTGVAQLHTDMIAATPAGSNIIGSILGRSANASASPTVTSSSAYTAGNAVGGIMTFTGAVDAALSGLLQSIRISVKSAQTAGMKLYLFDSNPTGTTWTDKTAPAIVSSDVPRLIGAYTMNTIDSGLGSHTLYTLDGIGRTFSVPSGTSLYGLLVTTGTPTFTTVADVSVYLGIMKD